MPDAGGSGGEFSSTGAFALGNGGRLDLRFVDTVITTSATAATDLAIFECGVAEALPSRCRPPTRPRGPCSGRCARRPGSAREDDYGLTDVIRNAAGRFKAKH